MTEERIVALEISEAQTAVSVEHLARAVEKLDATVSELRDVMNRGRGALWGIASVSAILGGSASIAAHKFLGVG